MADVYDSRRKAAARAEFARHWKLILAAAIGFSFTSVVTSGLGLFIKPISAEFGWGRAMVASAVTIPAIVTFLLSPLFGVFIDWWGVRRLAIPGLMLMAAVIAYLSQLNGSTWQWVAIWLIYSLATLSTKSTVWTASANSTFEAGRGLALGLVLSGSALAQAFTPPIANALIAAFGWRTAFVCLGLGWGAIAIVLCIFWLRDGYDINRTAKAAEAASGEVPTGPLLDVPGIAPREALHNGALWRIAISTFVIMTVTIALVVHQYDILEEIGVSRTQASLYAFFGGLAGIGGKLITGWLLDRYPARWVGGITIGVTACSFVFLLIPGVPVGFVVLALMINGYAGGTKLQLVGFLTAAYSGMRNFGTIFGFMASLIAAGSGLGPWLGGRVFDIWGSYEPLLWGGLAMTVLSTILLLGLPSYPDWSRSELRAEPAE